MILEQATATVEMERLGQKEVIPVTRYSLTGADLEAYTRIRARCAEAAAKTKSSTEPSERLKLGGIICVDLANLFHGPLSLGIVQISEAGVVYNSNRVYLKSQYIKLFPDNNPISAALRLEYWFELEDAPFTRSCITHNNADLRFDPTGFRVIQDLMTYQDVTRSDIITIRRGSEILFTPASIGVGLVGVAQRIVSQVGKNEFESLERRVCDFTRKEQGPIREALEQEYTAAMIRNLRRIGCLSQKSTRIN